MARRREAGEQTGEEQEIRGTGGAWTGILAAGGLVALAGGGLLAVAPRLSPKLDWIATRFAEMGISSGVVIACGVVCLALAMVTQGLAQLRRQAREFGDAARDIRGLYHDIHRIEDRAGRIQMEMSVLQEANKTLVKAAQDQSALQSAGQQIDATYRLAASLDQLGVRMEERLSAQQADLEKAIGLISGSASETRRQLESWLGHHDAWPLEDSFEDSFEEFEVSDLDERPMTLEGPEAPGEETAADLDALAEFPEFDDDEELEILVTLEEPAPEEIDGEDEIVLESEEDDPRAASQLEEPAPPEETPEETVQAAPGEAPTQLDCGLGLLDTLDDDGTPREDQDAPGEETAEVHPAAAAADRDPEPTATPEPPSIFATLEKTSDAAKGGPANEHSANPVEENLAELLSDEALQEALDKLKHRHDL